MMMFYGMRPAPSMTAGAKPNQPVKRYTSSVRAISDAKGPTSKVRILPPEDANVDPLKIMFFHSMPPYGPIASALQLALTQGGLMCAPMTGKPRFTISMIGESPAPPDYIFGLT